MIYVYYIGGPRDLSKQALNTNTPPRMLEIALLSPIHLDAQDDVTTVLPRRGIYHLLGDAGPTLRNTYIYAYTGTEQ